ncbi:killer cell lectin-like receptor subfamily B member 1A [Porphyrio hochstetteri]
MGCRERRTKTRKGEGAKGEGPGGDVAGLPWPQPGGEPGDPAGQRGREPALRRWLGRSPGGPGAGTPAAPAGRGRSRGAGRGGSCPALSREPTHLQTSSPLASGREVRSEGLCSNIWFWRAVAGFFAAIIAFIMYLHMGTPYLSRKVPVCPSLEPCASGWLYFQGKCYYLSEVEDDWNSSQNFCSQHNASLLVIENHQELDFMLKITKQEPWIGLYRRDENFFWVNGKALDNNLIEVNGSGNCAYLEPRGVSASGCSLTRKWVCSLNIRVAK